MTKLQWAQSAERPGLSIWWLDDSGALINFASGYTWSLKVGPKNGAALLTKTTNITGAAGAGVEPTGTPNVVVNWAAGELNLTAGVYQLELTATTGGLDRVLTADLVIGQVLT